MVRATALSILFPPSRGFLSSSDPAGGGGGIIIHDLPTRATPALWPQLHPVLAERIKQGMLPAGSRGCAGRGFSSCQVCKWQIKRREGKVIVSNDFRCGRLQALKSVGVAVIHWFFVFVSLLGGIFAYDEP